MTAEDPFATTIKRRLPLLAAFLSGALVVPASMLALVSPMAMDGGESFGSWLVVLFLLSQPAMLVASAIAGVLCYLRFSRWRFAIAVPPPAVSLLALKILGGM